MPFICKECGDVVKKLNKMDDDGLDLFRCRVCEKDVNELEVDYVEFSSKTESIPAGCAACGGPYPSCKTSCTVFDD